MEQKTVGIIGGRGLMGAYFAAIFKKAGYKILITGRKTKLTNNQLVQTSDIVIVSVPIDATIKVIREVTPLMKKDQLLMDLTSLKQEPVKAMLKSKARVIGLHPMFSDTNSLPGQTVIACPVRPGFWMPKIKKILTDRGAKVKIMDAKEHDETMAIVQSLVHFADIAFGQTLNEVKIPAAKYLSFASPASELKIAFAGRLLAQNPNLYGNIQLQNPHSLKILKKYVKSINDLLDINEKKDIKAFEKYFAKAGKKLETYKKKAFDDTNYLINAILERRRRNQEVLDIKTEQKNLKERTKDYSCVTLGPINTFSDIAAQNVIKDPGKITYLRSITEIFEAVEKGYVKCGVVPVENLLNGSVRETFDELYTRKVHISEKIIIPIQHALVALDQVNKKEIDTIMSHPQALGQCKKYLGKNFKHVRLVAVSSTMAGYEKIKGENDRHSASIIPAPTALKLNCNIISDRIADHSSNQTSFLVIKKGLYKETKAKRNINYETMMGFHFPGDKPGLLQYVFKLFSDQKINLSRIESRPAPDDIGNYIFFMDFKAHPSSARVKKVLKQLSKKTMNIKILGVNRK